MILVTHLLNAVVILKKSEMKVLQLTMSTILSSSVQNVQTRAVTKVSILAVTLIQQQSGWASSGETGPAEQNRIKCMHSMHF